MLDKVNVIDRWLTHPEILQEGNRIGIEVVQLFKIEGDIQEYANKLLSDMENGTCLSMLGGIPEGIVVKDPTNGKKIKCVRKQFRESNILKHISNKDANDVFNSINNCYPKEPRWIKAVQRYKDSGIVEDNCVRCLIRDVKKDFLEECSEQITKYMKLEMLLLMNLKKHLKNGI
jgi:hypothetical protein